MEVLVVDNRIDSEYFRVSDFPDKLHAGKNMFRLAGNARLLEYDQPVLIEVMPNTGKRTPIFHKVHSIRDAAGRRLVSIEVYPQYDQTGLATVTIVGTAKRRPNGRAIKGDWLNRPNVRWKRELYVDTGDPNITPIIFNRDMRITITENVKWFLSESYSESYDAANNFTSSFNTKELEYNSNPPTFVPPRGGDGTFGVTLVPGYDVLSTDFEFSASMVGGEIRFAAPTASSVNWFGSTLSQSLTTSSDDGGPYLTEINGNGLPNSWDFSASIIQVVNNSHIKLSQAYTTTYVNEVNYITMRQIGSGPTAQLVPQNNWVDEEHIFEPGNFTSTDFSITWQGDPVAYNISNVMNRSVANIILANLDPICGDVHAVRVWYRRRRFLTWEDAGVFRIEGRELYRDDTNENHTIRYGKFLDQERIDLYMTSSTRPGLEYSWMNPNGIEPMYSSSLKADSEAIIQGCILSGSECFVSASWPERPTLSHRFFGKAPIQVYEGCEYTIAFKARAYAMKDDYFLASRKQIDLPEGLPFGPELDENGNDANQNGGGFGVPRMEIYMSGSAMGHEAGEEVWGKRIDGGELGGDTQVEAGNYAQYTTDLSVPFQVGPDGIDSEDGATATAVVTSIGGAIPDVGQGALPAFDVDTVVYTFKPDSDGFIVPVFRVYWGKWIISDISIKCGQESGFTPNHTIITVPIPDVLKDEILDFKFDFQNILGIPAKGPSKTVKDVDFDTGNASFTQTFGSNIIAEGMILEAGTGD